MIFVETSPSQRRRDAQRERRIAPELERTEVAEMLSKSVSSLNDMLNDLLSLARLEAT